MRKVRGLRRYFRRFTRQNNQPEHLSMQRLQQEDYVESKLGLAPWPSTSFASNPPTRFRQEAFSKLLATHGLWQQELAHLAEPSYLAVWLMNSSFRDSQVVAAIGKRISHYEKVFGQPDPTAPPLPREYQAVPGSELLRWTAYYKEEPYTFDTDAASAAQRHEWEAYLQKVHFRIEQDPKLGTVYLINKGRVWVGQAL